MLKIGNFRSFNCNFESNSLLDYRDGDPKIAFNVRLSYFKKKIITKQALKGL